MKRADTMRLVGQIDPEAMKAQTMAAGEQMRMSIGTGVTNPLIEMTSQTLVPALDTMAKANNQTAAKIQADNAELAKGTDKLTESYVEAEKAVQEFKVGMEKLATSIMASDGFGAALDFMVGSMKKAAETMNDITAGEDTVVDGVLGGAATGAAAGALWGAFGGPLGIAVGGLVGGLAGGVLGYIGDEIDLGDKAAGLWDSLWGDDDKKPKGKAAGGPVNAGSKYQVNEIGQEFFTPSTHGTISPHSAYKNIMSDMSGMKAQISKQQASESNAPVTAEAAMAMAGATRSSSNPFSEDQEVRNALISLPSIMMENMNHLQTVNNTLEVKLTELSRNVA